MRRPLIPPATLALRLYTIVVVLFLGAPTIVAVGVAFGEDKIARFPPRGLSLRWFQAALTNETFVTSLWNSLQLAVLATLLAIAFGLPAALGLVRIRFRGKAAVEGFLLSPLTLPGVLYGLSMLISLGITGLGLGWWALVAAHVVIALPYVLRTTVAVYRGLDRGLEETAQVLGATPWKTFRYVTLPMLKSGLAAGGLFAFLNSFDNVPVSIFLTTSRDTTLPITIMSYLVNQDFDASVGAISALQIAVVLTLLLLLDRFYGVGRLVKGG